VQCLAGTVDGTLLPGNWTWQQNHYALSPGSWAAGEQDWEWTPSYYTWTPRGYVFVDGYWDYSVARRGVIFAPVQFVDGTYSQPGFSYSPSTVINPAVFATHDNHLFLRPSYGHYYFGDYYDGAMPMRVSFLRSRTNRAVPATIRFSLTSVGRIAGTPTGCSAMKQTSRVLEATRNRGRRAPWQLRPALATSAMRPDDSPHRALATLYARP
jgi:hypothetical protein